PPPPPAPPFDRGFFLPRGRIFTITSKYEVWAEDGTPVLYVERPTYPFRTLFAYLIGALAGSVVAGGTTRAFSNAAVNALAALAGFGLAFMTFVAVSMSVRPRRHVT